MRILLSLARVADTARFVMRHSSLVILLLLAFAAILPTRAAEPFEIRDGDRVLFLGDTLLEREGTYGYLETRMVEQFPDRKFTVRNLAFSADTPLGWSRASFDPAAKGFERLKEQLALVKPTVVFLGYGMAASLQEMTDRSQDWTLNRDPARYGAEPMSAARFKKELAQCMDAIVEISRLADGSGRAGFQPAVPGILPGTPNGERPAQRDTASANPRTTTPDAPGKIPGAAGKIPALPEANTVRFVLLSPIRHEDLRATRPGLPDPTEHNKLLEQYTKAIEELAKERGARFVDLFKFQFAVSTSETGVQPLLLTENGIHSTERGYDYLAAATGIELGWGRSKVGSLGQVPPLPGWEPSEEVKKATKDAIEWTAKAPALRAAIIRKNALFFHRWRPANETYLFGFRKHEQGQNAKEMPMFDPLIEKAEAEIEKLKTGTQKRQEKGAFSSPEAPVRQAAISPAGSEAPALPTEFGRTDSESPQRSAQFGPAASETPERSTQFGPATPEAPGRSTQIGPATPETPDRSTQIGPATSETPGRSTQIGPATPETPSRSTQIGPATSETPGRSTQIGTVTPETPDRSTQSGPAVPETPSRSTQSGPAASETAGCSTPSDATGQKSPVLIAANAETGDRPPAASNQQPATPDPTRQTGAEKPAPAPSLIPTSKLPLPTFTLAEGLEISLWAENPHLAKPTQCNWDAQGRLLRRASSPLPSSRCPPSPSPRASKSPSGPKTRTSPSPRSAIGTRRAASGSPAARSIRRSPPASRPTTKSSSSKTPATPGRPRRARSLWTGC